MDNLKEILIQELLEYSGEGAGSIALPVFDENQEIYAIIVEDYPTRQLDDAVIILARLVDNKIIIEEDTTDKPLFRALLQQGVPREQIILAYANEPYPEIQRA